VGGPPRLAPGARRAGDEVARLADARGVAEGIVRGERGVDGAGLPLQRAQPAHGRGEGAEQPVHVGLRGEREGALEHRGHDPLALPRRDRLADAHAPRLDVRLHLARDLGEEAREVGVGEGGGRGGLGAGHGVA
jgi:hypothetical protein